VNRISSVVVSTDDAEIADEAVLRGAIVHMRKPQAAAPAATAAAVVSDFFAHDHGTRQSTTSRIVYLQPTSPFRNQSHIELALAAVESGKGGSLVSVCVAKQLPEKMLLPDGKRVRAGSEARAEHGTNRQDLPKRFYPNGAIYVFSEAEFRMKNEVPVDGSLFIEMDEISSLDIDSPADLEIARALATHAGI
jgi:CMP-N-acetylneuraminic acid synthetase